MAKPSHENPKPNLPIAIATTLYSHDGHHNQIQNSQINHHASHRSGMESGLGVRGGRSINKKKIETPNKHSFNKLSTKKNTQNYCFLRYYNAVIYEN